MIEFPDAGVMYQGRLVRRVYPLHNSPGPLPEAEMAILAEHGHTAESVKAYIATAPACESGCGVQVLPHAFLSGGLIECDGQLSYRCMRHFALVYCDLMDLVIHEPPVLVMRVPLRPGKLRDWLNEPQDSDEDAPPELLMRSEILLLSRMPCSQIVCKTQANPEALEGGITLERFPDTAAVDRIRWHCAKHFPLVPEPPPKVSMLSHA